MSLSPYLIIIVCMSVTCSIRVKCSYITLSGASCSGVWKDTTPILLFYKKNVAF